MKNSEGIYNFFKDRNKKVDVKPAVDAKLVTKQSLNIVAVCLHLGCFFCDFWQPFNWSLR